MTPVFKLATLFTVIIAATVTALTPAFISQIEKLTNAFCRSFFAGAELAKPFL